ncbi:MAG TPA: helix-turn-helix domain-containing protein [Polyangiaceae bacterium]|jgi:AraC-like DNA-binding protein|nr:helix-turn-helix domain-containing protein [Polyangiaceae bacterium]
MEYLGRTPSPPLDRFIERIWYCSDAPPRTRERVLPSGGAVGLAINLFEEEARVYDPAIPGAVQTHSGAVVAGTRTRSVLLEWPHRASIVGVHFRPGGALPFLGISPAEIVDDHAKLDDLWGCDGRNLREQLVEARSSGERFRLVEAALLRRLQRARPVHPAARAAMAAFRDGVNRVSVGEVATMVGLSRRRFIQVFETEVGLTPKLYARLQRFHCVKQRIAMLSGPPSWATFALECGYFDQSHMIRDFVEFSSMSPTSYLQSRTGETRFDQFIHAYRQEK